MNSGEERTLIYNVKWALNRARFLISPLLVGLFPLLSLYTRNIDEVPASQLLQPSMWTILITIVFFASLLLLTRNLHKISFVVSLFWIAFYLYVPITESTHQFNSRLIDLDSILIPLWIGILSASAICIFRSRRKFDVLMKFLSVVALTLLSLQIFPITKHFIESSGSEESMAWETKTTEYLANEEEKYMDVNAINELPNIYYIVLDSYPRSDSLKEHFSFDNQEFDNLLQDLGFKILDSSHSNYNQTSLSVPATMNMSYYTSIENLKTNKVLDKLWRINNTFDYLRTGGYKVFNNSSFYTSAFNKYADGNVECMGKTNELMLELINLSVLKPVSFLKETQRQDRRADTLCTISSISEAGSSEKPKIVFTHILPPHPPYLFGENGEDTTDVNLSLDGRTRWLAKELYVDQLKYINKLMAEVVNDILNKSKNSIIIIQSDHGTLSSATRRTNLYDKRPVVFKERHRNYSALYLPEYCDKSQIYDAMSNVNTFRVVFNSCFNAGYELLEDRIYYSPSNKFNAEFEEITDQVIDRD